MEFKILGPLEIREEGRPVEPGGRAPRLILTMLLLSANRIVPISRLIDELWPGGPPDSAVNAVQVHVSNLRKALSTASQAQVLLTRRPGYLIRTRPDELDAETFERLADEASAAMREGSPAIAASKLRRALDLWQGTALAEFANEPFAASEAIRLEEMRLAAKEDLIEADLAIGRHEEVLPDLLSLIEANPLRERLRGQLMVALYRCNRQSEALEVFRKTRDFLVVELGVDPGPALEELHQSILRHDSALDLRSQRFVPRERRGYVLPLLGRREQLLALNEAHATARRGRTVVVAITGPPGAGKSRLVEEFLAPISPDLIRRSTAYRATASRPGDLSAQLRLAVDPPPIGSVVVVDDAQWADPASLRYCRNFVRSHKGTLMLFALRPLRAFDRVIFDEIADVASESVELRVGALHASDVEEVLIATDRELVAQEMVASSGGLPFRLEQMASHWLAVGAVKRQGQSLVIHGELPAWAGPPYSRNRLDAMPAEKARLVEAVSIAQLPIPPPLAAALTGVDQGRIEKIGNELASAGVIAQNAAGYVPVHDLAARTVEAELPELRKATIYAQLGDHFAEGRSTEVDLASAGVYYLAAGQYERATRTLGRAGLASYESGAGGEALKLLDAALLAASRSQAREPVFERRLRSARAVSRQMTGFVEEADEDFRELLSEVSPDEELDWVISAASAADELLNIHEAEVRAAVAEAQAVRGEKSDRLASIVAYRASLIARAGFVEEADVMLAKARELKAGGHRSATGDETSLLVTMGEAAVHYARGDAVRAVRSYSDALRQASTLGDTWRIPPLCWGQFPLYLSGRVIEARTSFFEALQVAERTASVAAVAAAHNNSAAGLAYIGRFADALMSADHHLEATYSMPRHEHVARAQRAQALLGLKRVPEALDEIENAFELCPPGPNGWFWRVVYRSLHLAIKAEADQWDDRLAMATTTELMQGGRWFWGAEVLALRARIEGDAEHAVSAAEIALDIGAPMTLARAVDAGGLWETSLGTAARRRLRGMAHHMPAEYLDDWESRPEVSPAFS